jgi:hypothetical protein
LKKKKKLAPAIAAHTTMVKRIHSAKAATPEWECGTVAWSVLVDGMFAWVCWGSMDSEYLVGTAVGAAVGVGDRTGVGLGVAVGVGVANVGDGVHPKKHAGVGVWIGDTGP